MRAAPALRSAGLAFRRSTCGVLTVGPSASPTCHGYYAMALGRRRDGDDPALLSKRGGLLHPHPESMACATMRAGTASPFTSVRLQTSLRRMRTFPRYARDPAASRFLFFAKG